MAITNQIHSIIVPATSANFTAHTYSEVYIGSATTVTINGISVVAAAGSSIKITVRDISATPNVYLLGDKIDLSNGSSLITG